MPEQRSPLKEYRHLEEKLATVGLSPAEHARFRQLREIVSPEASAPRPGFDVNAAAEALKASLEPAGLRRPTPPAAPLDIGAPWPEAGAPALDAEAPGYDPNAQPAGESQGYAPDAQSWDPNQPQEPIAASWDPNQPYDPNAPAWDPNAQPADASQGYAADAQSWDPNQPYDPNAPYGYAAVQPEATDLAGDAAAGLDPGSGALDQGPVTTGAVEGQAASWDGGAQAGEEPAVRSYDLAPEAFDAAPLPPPEPGPGGYHQAPWDAMAAGAPPPEPAAGTPQDGEPIEVEPTEVELVEAEPLPEAPAQGSDFFTPGPLTPDFTGAQPLEAGSFTEKESGLSAPPEAAGWPEAEAPAGQGGPAPAEAGFQRAEANGPGAVEAGEPAAVELGPAAEAEGAAAEAVPLASPSEFLSSFEPAPLKAEPPPAPPVDGLDAGEVAIEELPPVAVNVEEIAEAPEPVAPLPGPDLGRPSASFVAGEHRVVVHTLEGQVLRGTIADVDLDADAIPLVAGPGGPAGPIAASRVKAIFFMLLPGGQPPAPEGRKVRVTFRDGRQVAGFSADYDPEAAGFFMVPADSRTNTGRIWVYRAAVRQVSVT